MEQKRGEYRWKHNGEVEYLMGGHGISDVAEEGWVGINEVEATNDDCHLTAAHWVGRLPNHRIGGTQYDIATYLV